MFRKAFLLVACMTLAGCASYGYRGGSGDYYYGSPTTTYRYYGAPYGSLGYGRGYGWYGGAGVGSPYWRHNGWSRYPYGYGGGYYRPPPVIVRPVYPGRPDHRPPRRHNYEYARPESGRPGHGGQRSERADGARPGGPGPGWGGRPPVRGDADRPGRPQGGWNGRPQRGEGTRRPEGRPGFRPPQRPERVTAPAARPAAERPMRAAPARVERSTAPRAERRTSVTQREARPV